MRGEHSNVAWLTPLRDELLRHTAIVFLGMAGVHLCSLLFQMAVSRRLPQEEYALLAAFLGVLAIVGQPASALSAGISHHSSLLVQQGQRGDVRRLLRKWLLLTGVPTALLGAAVLFLHAPMASLFHLDRVAPVVIAGAVFPALFWLPVLNGAGQGLQLFKWCSAANLSGALARLALGAGFVWFLHPACGWAMLGHGLGMYTSVLVLAVGLLLMLGGQPTTAKRLPSIRMYVLQSLFVQTAYIVLMTADVVLVKHFVPGDTEFAYAATLGRIVAFLPAAVAMAMFPKVASSGGGTAKHRKIFLQSFGYTALFVAAAAAGCLVFPRLLLRILFGIRSAPESMMVLTRLMALAMSASALLNVTVQFLLAQRRFKATLATGLACLVYLLAVYFFHQNVKQIVCAALVMNFFALLAGLFAVLRKRPSDNVFT